MDQFLSISTSLREGAFICSRTTKIPWITNNVISTLYFFQSTKIVYESEKKLKER